MAALPSWAQDNWFALVQSVGIAASLIYTARSFRQGIRDQRTSQRLSLASHHRELWSSAHREPSLRRITADTADLVIHPISVEEREFLLEVIYHFQTCWELAREGDLVSLETLRRDATQFFGLPIPRVVWCESRASRDPSFVNFIEGCRSAVTEDGGPDSRKVC